jgi:PilZ domain-containing protein
MNDPLSKIQLGKNLMASPPSPTDRRRSERVMLRMLITVIAEDTQRQRQQFEAMTQVVNAHGGLMKMQRELHVGQPMLLINPKNSVEQACRVVRVDDTADGDFAIAFEFDKPDPKFWPVVFPPEDWKASA